MHIAMLRRGQATSELGFHLLSLKTVNEFGLKVTLTMGERSKRFGHIYSTCAAYNFNTIFLGLDFNVTSQ